MWRILPPVPVRVKFTCKLIEIVGNAMRLMGNRGRFHQPRIERELLDQRKLAAVIEALKGCRCQGSLLPPGKVLRHEFTRVAQHRTTTRVSVLNIENGIVAGLFDDLLKIEIENRVIVTVEHHESDRVAAHFVDHFPQAYALPCPFGHFYGLTASQQPDQLHDLDIEIGAAAATRFYF